MPATKKILQPDISLKFRLTVVILVLVLIPCLYLYLSYFKGALIDDAYITFQYARNLRDHHIWGFFPGTTTNTATSPLNVILTAAMGLILHDFVEVAIWLALIESLALLAFLWLISQKLFHSYYFGFEERAA